MSNLQVPTTSESPWGKVNVSKFMDFGEIWPGTEKNPDFLDFGTIKKNNCYMLGQTKAKGTDSRVSGFLRFVSPMGGGLATMTTTGATT